MMNFFTKLLTPVFIALGMVNPTPVVETPVPNTQVQQELIELRQKVQEFESQNEPEIEPKNQEAEEIVLETKPVEVKKEVVVKKPAPVVQPVVKADPVVIEQPIVLQDNSTEEETEYKEKLVRFYAKIEKIEEEGDEKVEQIEIKYKRLGEIVEEITVLNKKFEEYDISIQLNYVDGYTGTGSGIPSSLVAGQMENELNKRKIWIMSYPAIYEELNNEHKSLLEKRMKDINNLNDRLTSEAKDLQIQWSIRVEDWVY